VSERTADEAIAFARTWPSVRRGTSTVAKLLVEIDRLHKVEAAARVVLDALKDTRMGPSQEDAFDALLEAVEAKP
jgi:hypothetical protein